MEGVGMTISEEIGVSSAKRRAWGPGALLLLLPVEAWLAAWPDTSSDMTGSARVNNNSVR